MEVYLTDNAKVCIVLTRSEYWKSPSAASIDDLVRYDTRFTSEARDFLHELFDRLDDLLDDVEAIDYDENIDSDDEYDEDENDEREE